MNKIRIIIFLIFLLLVFKIEAQGLKFGWNIGNFNIGYDILNKEFDPSLEIFQFTWVKNKFSIGFNIFDIHWAYEISHCSILPVTLAYVPLNYEDFLFFFFFSKAGWEQVFIDNHINNGFYGSVGIKFFIFPDIDFLHYSPYFSIFTEYDNHKKLKIGLSIDISAIILFLLHAKAESLSEK
jgi:hypothetical protein